MARAEIIQVQFGGSSPAAKKGGAGGERLKRRPDGIYQLEKRYVLPDGTQNAAPSRRNLNQAQTSRPATSSSAIMRNHGLNSISRI